MEGLELLLAVVGFCHGVLPGANFYDRAGTRLILSTRAESARQAPPSQCQLFPSLNVRCALPRKRLTQTKALNLARALVRGFPFPAAFQLWTFSCGGMARYGAVSETGRAPERRSFGTAKLVTGVYSISYPIRKCGDVRGAWAAVYEVKVYFCEQRSLEVLLALPP